MGTPTRSLDAEINSLRKAYAALNRNDIPAMVNLFDPQIVRIEPEGFPFSGTYRGRAAVTAHLSKARATWAEGSCEPDRFIIAGPGETVIAYIHVRVRLNGHVEWIDARTADVFTFRGGKAVEFRTFTDDRQALEWAGCRAPDAPPDAQPDAK